MKGRSRLEADALSYRGVRMEAEQCRIESVAIPITEATTMEEVASRITSSLARLDLG